MGQARHLIFYDGSCGLCDRTVQIVFAADKREVFAFAPLQGVTAEYYLKNMPAETRDIDSIILIEDFATDTYRIYVRSKAVFRICRTLGGPWFFPGLLSFFPSWLFDWSYRLIAKIRHRFFPQTICFIPPRNRPDRFFP